MQEKGKAAIVVNPSSINKPDLETISDVLKKTEGRVVTVEEHQLIGGMGSMLAHQLNLKKIPFTMKSLAVAGTFGQSAYMAVELYKKHGLDAASIEKAAFDLI